MSRFINQIHQTGATQQPLDEALRDFEQQVREESRTAVSNALRQFSDNIKPVIEAEVAAGTERMRALLRREVVNNLLFFMRRLRSADSIETWRTALLTGAADYCSQVALFAVDSQGFHLEEARGALPDVMQRLIGQPIPLAQAAGFQQVLDSRDTVVALLNANQVSPLVVGLFESLSNRAHLFPIQRVDRIAAILYCLPSGRAVDIAGLELLTMVAGETLTSRQLDKAVPAGLIGLNATPANAEVTHRDDHDQHLRAARFAKASIAKIFLDHSAAVHQARQTKTIYLMLREPIEMGRQQFLNDYLKGSTSMADYYHQELVQTLAGGDEAALGEDYPGPLL